MAAGVPTGVYRPVNVRRPVWRLTLKVVMASLLWLHAYRKLPVGSMLKLRG